MNMNLFMKDFLLLLMVMDSVSVSSCYIKNVKYNIYSLLKIILDK